MEVPESGPSLVREAKYQCSTKVAEIREWAGLTAVQISCWNVCPEGCVRTPIP